MENYLRSKLVRHIVIACLGIVTLITVPLLWKWLTVGTLKIDSIDQNISIKIVDTNSKSVNYTKDNEHTIKLSKGLYTVTVNGKTQSVVKTVKIEGRKTNRITLNDVKLLDYEPVAAEFATSVMADTNNLVYLDVASARLVQVDSQNIYKIFKDKMFKQVTWIDTTTGIARATDGKPYLINMSNQSSTLISNLDDNNVSYGVSIDKSVYVFKDGAIYTMDKNGSLQKLFAIAITTPLIKPSKDTVATMSFKTTGSETPKITAFLSTFALTGKLKGSVELPYTEGLESRYEIAWSPNGNYLALTDAEGTGKIYDSNLKKLADIPIANSHHPVWIDDSTLAYTEASNIWQYSIATKNVVQLSAVTGSKRIQAMSYNEPLKQLYLTLSVSSNHSEIVRISLEGKKGNQKAYDLSAILPLTLSDNCYVTYMNFTKPSILYSVISDNDTATCKQSSTEELASYGIDTNTENNQVITLP
jgi:hypothetical protein